MNTFEWIKRAEAAEARVRELEIDALEAEQVVSRFEDRAEAAEARVRDLTEENERNRQGFEFHAGRAERERERADFAEHQMGIDITARENAEAAEESVKALELGCQIDRARAEAAEERVKLLMLELENSANAYGQWQSEAEHQRLRAEAAEARVRAMQVDITEMWERAEAAEARAEANFQALQESEADLARTQERAEAAEGKAKEQAAASRDFVQRLRNFASQEQISNTGNSVLAHCREAADTIDALEARVRELESQDDDWSEEIFPPREPPTVFKTNWQRRAETAEAALADMKDDYLRRHKDATDRMEEIVELKRQLHDLKQAALVEGQRLREALAEALADKNYAEGQLREAQSERDLFSSTVDDQDVALIEARRQMHELSVKYVCALRRAREMEEALKAGLTDFENHTDSHPQWVLNHYHRARAALASQKTIGEPDEA
jgi:hypothetical protein